MTPFAKGHPDLGALMNSGGGGGGLFSSSLSFGDIATAGGFGLLQAGLGFFANRHASEQAHKQRKRSHQLSMRQARERTMLQNRQIQDRNNYALAEHNMRKRFGQQQIALNNQAANDAYAQEQLKLQEQFRQSAFKREGMRGRLMEAMGSNAATNEGNRGRSFDRAAAINTMGNYGRSMEQMREADISRRTQSQANIRNIERRARGANMQAYSSFAMMPYMQRQLPMPTNFGGPQRSSFNTALQIGQGLMGATNTAFSMLS